MSKDMDICLETYARFYEEVQYYHKRIISWLKKYGHIHEAVSEKGYTYYSPMNNTVYFGEDHTEFAKGHEYGHAFWHKMDDPRVNYIEFWEIAMLLFDEREEEVREFFNNYGKVNDIVPLTDFISVWYAIPSGFRGHDQSYWQAVSSDRVGDEVFASFFSYIYNRNFTALKIFKKNFPKFYDSCLALIDKGVYKAHNN